MESYDLVEWFWVDMSDISFQVRSSLPIFFYCIKIQLRNLLAKFQDAALSCWKVIIELGGFGDI